MKVISAVVNNPIFIEIQYYTLKKYLLNDFEYIVFNDAKKFKDFTNDNDETIYQQIEEICHKLNVKIINIENEHHKEILGATTRCANSMNFILEYQKQNPDKYLLIDSDMFLVDYLDISKYEKYDAAVVLQQRDNYYYIWNGIYYFDFTKLKNYDLMNWNTAPNCDVGGMMNKWLLNQTNHTELPNTHVLRWSKNQYHTDNIYMIKHLWSLSWNKDELPENLKTNKNLIEFLENDFRNENNKYFCEIYDNIFLHYRAGGNWRGEGINKHKILSRSLKEVLCS